jgi:hypothetical protein
MKAFLLWTIVMAAMIAAVALQPSRPYEAPPCIGYVIFGTVWAFGAGIFALRAVRP